ncbi:hypothetical protein ACTZWT_09825 [Rhodopseudomonas sp. NSM]|uniref:hypothetical protein n=1 Tax=Rhodopseudomonas sp. NSM TaxID=3457630 RepID=UPI0040372D2E
MKSKAIGRSGLIIAAGLCACLWGPLQPRPAAAAPAASQDSAAQQSTPAAVKKKKPTRSTRQVKKKSPPAKAAKPTAENETDNNERATASTDAKPDGTARTGPQAGGTAPSEALPPSVANANAQLPPVAGAAGATAGSTVAPQQTPAAPDGATNAEVVPPEEVNELDRAAADTPPAVMAATIPASTGAIPVAGTSDPVTLGAAQMSSATSNDGAWDKASLIGKIFIAAGGLLTLASAARMFMA